MYTIFMTRDWTTGNYHKRKNSKKTGLETWPDSVHWLSKRPIFRLLDPWRETRIQSRAVCTFKGRTCRLVERSPVFNNEHRRELLSWQRPGNLKSSAWFTRPDQNNLQPYLLYIASRLFLVWLELKAFIIDDVVCIVFHVEEFWKWLHCFWEIHSVSCGSSCTFLAFVKKLKLRVGNQRHTIGLHIVS